MLKTFILALALLFVSTGTADAGYLWKGDIVHVRNLCSDKASLMELTEAYLVSASDGDATWTALKDTGRCSKIPELREYVLGERHGWWTLPSGLSVEAWEIFRDGTILWAGFVRNSGDHATPYKPEEKESSGSALKVGFLWKGDTVLVKSVCFTQNLIMSLANLYVTEPYKRGKAALMRAEDLGLCFRADKKIQVRLGNLLGRWYMFDHDDVLEVWEVVDKVGDIMYAMSSSNLGPHKTPYVLSTGRDI